ncbi:MAG: nuclear transport factor 2 family protein [Actinomycetota bacterium]
MTPPLDLEALVHRYASVTSSMDVDAYVALFSEDCIREDPIGTPANHGREEVRASWQAVTSGVTSISFTPSDIHVVANCAAYHFEVVTDLGEMKVTVNGIELFEFNESGEIQSMKAYWADTDLVVG